MFKLTNYNSPTVKKGNFLDSFFDEFFDFPVARINNVAFKLDVKEDDKNYLIEADLPGLKKDEVKISYNNDALTIAAERKEETNEEKDNYVHRERSYSAMQRTLYLPNIDPKNIKAKLDEGVLKLTIKKDQIENKQDFIEIE